jgi:hypothetical protein
MRMNIRSILGVMITLVILLGATTSMLLLHQAEAWTDRNGDGLQKAPVAITGENVYVVWWTDKGTPNTNGEVMFRASTDGGVTFGDKINLSNTNNTDSVDAEIDSDADSVVVTWWERDQTSDTPVMRVSTDNGATFGPMLMLANNGTIGEEEGEPGSEATAEEE